MKMYNPTKRRAVAPVIATLLMIAVAVAMSVIIFMWSQGFLSQTSSSTGGQQGAQNQAAQSSISIESGTFSASTTQFTVIVRNVGAVAVTLGSVSVTGSSSNVAFTGNLLTSIPTSGNIAQVTSSDTGGVYWVGTSPPTCAGGNPNTAASNYQNIAKGGAVVLAFTGCQGINPGTHLSSGDVINIKITTSVGTFAQAQFTVP